MTPSKRTSVSGSREAPSRRRVSWLIVAMMMAVGAFIWSWRHPLAAEAPPERVRRSAKFAGIVSGATLPPVEEKQLPPDPARVVELAAMTLRSKTVKTMLWNSGPDGFGLSETKGEGTVFGPASLIYHHGIIYLLDTVNKRILAYNKDGLLVSKTALPGFRPTDLVLDASDSSLLAIDHLQDTVYKIKEGKAEFFKKAAMKVELPLHSQFEYDAETGKLYHQYPADVADIQNGNTIVVTRREGEPPVTIRLDRPITSVEETAVDGQGNLWIMFALEGDYRTRRLARLDAAGAVVGTAQVDMWWFFDSTRHMAATENGVVIFGGDEKIGRLVSYDYDGLIQKK